MVDPTVYTKLFAFSGALSALAMAASGWWRGGPAEDDIVVDAADLILGSLSNADDTRGVEAQTGHNWRNDISVQDAIDMARERDLRSMRDRN